MLELAIALKRERPARTVAQITRILRAVGWSPSETALLRHFSTAPACRSPAPERHGRRRCSGGSRRNGRTSCGPGMPCMGRGIGGRKTYLFAFIDDHSRVVVGHRWGFAEDPRPVGGALRPALAARGVPASVYVDNGSAFVDAWLLRACAKLGIRLTHSTPAGRRARAKIERFFEAVNDQFLVEIGQSADAIATPADPCEGRT
ncbi:MAG: DDE-type integrase/transposase/recombinase [Kineosporiaceae bacterium]